MNRPSMRLPPHDKTEPYGGVNKAQTFQIPPPAVNTFTSHNEPNGGVSRAQAPQIPPNIFNTSTPHGEFEPYSGASRMQAHQIPPHTFNTFTFHGKFESHVDMSKAQAPQIPPHFINTFTSHGEFEANVDASRAQAPQMPPRTANTFANPSVIPTAPMSSSRVGLPYTATMMENVNPMADKQKTIPSFFFPQKLKISRNEKPLPQTAAVNGNNNQVSNPQPFHISHPNQVSGEKQQHASASTNSNVIDRGDLYIPKPSGGFAPHVFYKEPNHTFIPAPNQSLFHSINRSSFFNAGTSSQADTRRTIDMSKRKQGSKIVASKETGINLTSFSFQVLNCSNNSLPSSLV